ncbi:MAG: ABC transporter substrate-binding protein [Desulfobacteraceae bacterium]|nr:ABC transporter substrate-binding protein [Desulfobacteraceae bacterium]
MRIIVIINIILTACFLFACTPSTIGPSVDGPLIKLPVGESELLSQAEARYLNKDWEAAIQLYQQFLTTNPSHTSADSIIFRISHAYKKLERYNRALNTYNQLISTYPASALTIETKMEIADVYYLSGQYGEAIRIAQALLGDPLSATQILKVQRLLADAHMASGESFKAVPYYAEIQGRLSGIAADANLIRLKEAILQLTEPEAAGLLEMALEIPAPAYILYHLGSLQAVQMAFDQSLETLTQFVEKYPENEMVAVAYQFLDQLFQHFSFQPYTFGCLLPLSGPYETYGKRALQGIELALTQYANEKNLPFRIVVKDTASDPRTAVEAVRSLAQSKVAAIIGPIDVAESAAVEAQRLNIPMITITQKDNIAEIGSYIFRNFITPRMQVKTLADYAVGQLGLKTFAIMYPEEPYGTMFMNLFWAELTAHGAKVTAIESYSPDRTDFSEAIKKMVGGYYEIPDTLIQNSSLLASDRARGKTYAASAFGLETLFSGPVRKIMGILSDAEDDLTANRNTVIEPGESKPLIDFEAIFIPDSSKIARLILPQLAFNDITGIQLLGTNLWHSDPFIEMARQYVQGALLVDGFFAQSNSAEVRKFIDAFQQIYETPPSIIEASSFDNAVMLMDILSQPDIMLRSEVKNALLSVRGFRGVTGLTSFPANGDAEKDLYLLQIKGKRFVEVKKSRWQLWP